MTSDDRHMPKQCAVYPMVHANGTSKERLLEALNAVWYALGDAYDRLKDAAPNRRDYYLLPPDRWDAAQDQHRERMRALDALQANVETEMAAIDSQG